MVKKNKEYVLMTRSGVQHGTYGDKYTAETHLSTFKERMKQRKEKLDGLRVYTIFK